MNTMLTKRQKELLSIIYKYIKNSGYPPSFEEMREELGVASNQSIIDHLKGLEQKRFIKRGESAARGIKILKKGFVALNKPQLVPFVGTSSAGYGLEAVAIEGEWQTISREVARFKDDVFLVKISGDSMTGAGINDGDIVLVREQTNFLHKDIVLARVNGETTVKRFIKQNGKSYLKPENTKYKNIYFTDYTEMIGKIVTVLSKPKVRAKANKEQISEIPGLFPDTLSERKRVFLNQLKSAGNKTKYKRYVKSPLRYAGGKSLAVGLIVELIPDNVKKVISPFFGGGSVEIACALELGLPVVAYDIFDILINYWKVQLDNPEELYKRLSKLEPTREEFKSVKNKLKKYWKDEKKIRSTYDLAALYYFNHNTSYGPHFLGWPSSVYLQDKRYEKMIKKVREFKAENLTVDCASFEDIMDKHKNDFLYCDPPYYLNGDSKTFVGMYPHRNFPVHHVNFNHEALRDFLLNHKGGFVLSYNDCSTIRRWYKNFSMSNPKWQYTFSQGDTRIGENRLKNNNGSHVKQSHELIIWENPE